MKPFRLNRHHKPVFPASVFVDLDFSTIRDLDHLDAIIHRDFEVKAPTGSDIAQRASDGLYTDRYQLLRDLGLHLFWANRFALTMYDKRPTRWSDVARRRDDVFVPLLRPWQDRSEKVEAVEWSFHRLPARWDETMENQLFNLLFDVLSNKLYHAAELPALKPTVSEALATGGTTTVLSDYDPDYPRFGIDEILDASAPQPELEALQRWAMVVHNQHPWDRSQAELKSVGDLGDDDVVVVFHPKNRDVLDFIQRARANGTEPPTPTGASSAVETVAVVPAATAVKPVPPMVVGQRTDRRATIEALAVRRGEVTYSNADVVRNAPPSWSPMSADEITTKTGIEQRRYTAEPLEQIALEAARSALEHTGRQPHDIGAVLFCSCTSTRLIPSTATWISGELGIAQTNASADIIAACAGFPYGMAQALRLLDDVNRPVLLVMAEKFSDKIGNARPSRMIFGDGAAAMVISPTAVSKGNGGRGSGSRGNSGADLRNRPGFDVEVVQTYASGPSSEVNSIIWPNPDFDNDITVYGPEVKALVRRYLDQMISELGGLDGVRTSRHQSGVTATTFASRLLDDIDVIVPHQANRTMIVDIAEAQGVPVDKLYFNIERVGNVSAASIPMAIADAVHDGVISERSLIFAPGFGAGAVGGYVVCWIEPSMIAPESGTRGDAADPVSTDGHADASAVADASADNDRPELVGVR